MAFSNEAAVPVLLGTLRKVPQSFQKKMNRDISEAEVAAALKELASRTFPGADGLGATFYKRFATKLALLLRDVHADVLERRLLPSPMCQVVTVLMSTKKINDRDTIVADFRPIGLLTTDYEILAKTIAKQMERGLRYMVGDHQACGFKGRLITTNVHRMRVIIEAAEVLNQLVGVLHVDLRKASDIVSHPSLFSLLKYSGIGGTIPNYVKLCYTDITTPLLVNGWKCSPSSIYSSVRQSCSMSPILFTL